MSKEGDGGPAYPVSTNREDEVLCGHRGMSLRDYFAGQALVGLLAHSVEYQVYPTREDNAVEAYRQADSMLKARDLK